MNNLGILIKNNFRVFIGSLKYSKRKRRFAASGLLFAVLSVYIVAVMALSAVSQTKMFLDYGKPEYALLYSVVYTRLLMLLTAIMRGVTTTRTSDAGSSRPSTAAASGRKTRIERWTVTSG